MVQEDVGKLRCITFTDNRLNDRLLALFLEFLKEKKKPDGLP